MIMITLLTNPALALAELKEMQTEKTALEVKECMSKANAYRNKENHDSEKYTMMKEKCFSKVKNFFKPSSANLKEFQSTYDGDIKDGMKHGYGMFFNPIKNIKYIGTWENNVYHGEGVLLQPGSIISGIWKDGVLDGKTEILYCSKLTAYTQMGKYSDYDLINAISKLTPNKGAMDTIKSSCRNAAIAIFDGIYQSGEKITGEYHSAATDLTYSGVTGITSHLGYMKNSYSGDFKNDAYHGKGHLIINNKRYQNYGEGGVYVKDLTEDFCMIRYDGEFENGEFINAEVDAIEDALSIDSAVHQFTLEQETATISALLTEADGRMTYENSTDELVALEDSDMTTSAGSILGEDGDYLIQETYIVGDGASSTTNLDPSAQNELFESADDTILDFSESNPFGDVGSSS